MSIIRGLVMVAAFFGGLIGLGVAIAATIALGPFFFVPYLLIYLWLLASGLTPRQLRKFPTEIPPVVVPPKAAYDFRVPSSPTEQIQAIWPEYEPPADLVVADTATSPPMDAPAASIFTNGLRPERTSLD